MRFFPCFNDDGGSKPEILLKHNLTVLKQVIYVAYMLKIISLTVTSHSNEFWKNFKCVHEICDFFNNE